MFPRLVARRSEIASSRAATTYNISWVAAAELSRSHRKVPSGRRSERLVISFFFTNLASQFLLSSSNPPFYLVVEQLNLFTILDCVNFGFSTMSGR